MPKNDKLKIQIQVNNIMETLNSFDKSDIDSDELAEALFQEIRRTDEETMAAFDEFIQVILIANKKALKAEFGS